VLDGAVLAGGVHRLEDEQQRPAVLGVKQLLFLRQPFGTTFEELGGFAFVDLQSAGIGGIEILEPEAPAGGDAEGFYVLREASEDGVVRHAPHARGLLFCMQHDRRWGA